MPRRRRSRTFQRPRTISTPQRVRLSRREDITRSILTRGSRPPLPTVTAIRFGLRSGRRVTVTQSVFRPNRAKVSKRHLRLAVTPSECTRRKNYKKDMMRKLAAQVHAGGGMKSLRKWRKRRNRQTSNVRLHC